MKRDSSITEINSALFPKFCGTEDLKTEVCECLMWLAGEF